MLTSRFRTHTAALLGAVMVFIAALSACDDTDSGLRRVLTRYNRFNPPESISTVAPIQAPVVYVYRTGGEFKSVVNPDPLTGIEDAPEQSLVDLAAQLKFVRQVLQDEAGDSVRVADDILLVGDRNLTFNGVMSAVYTVNHGTFIRPHLVTSDGYLHAVEPPTMHPQAGPMGWSAWMWITEGDTIRWMPIPESAVNPVPQENPDSLWSVKIPPVNGEMDIDRAVASMATELENLDYVPDGMDRLIGIWAYDDLPYPTLMKVMDALRFPADGKPIGGRITMLQGWRWAPPPDEAISPREPS
jgi:hypothetical protein